MATVAKGRGRNKTEAREEVLALSGTDSEDEDGGGEGEEEEGGWGSKKKHYYGGNTGEEMEDDVDDSDLEEDRAEEVEASKLQRKQLDDMEEEDFLDTFSLPVSAPKANDQEKEKTEDTAPTMARDLSQLSRKEQLALFKQKAPEFEGVVADFQLKMAEAARLARVAALADVGQLPEGPQVDFVKSKLQLLLNYCTNIAAYLMFRAQGESLTLHPVTGRLVQYRQLLDSLKPMDEIVMPGVEALLERLDLGDEVSTLVREEKRRARRKAEGGRKKKLSLAQQEEDQVVPEKKKKRKRKNKNAEEDALENISGLTHDERMAVELYNVIKKSRKNEDLEESADEGDDLIDSLDRVEEAPGEEVTGATTNDGAEYDEEGEEKRAVTYKMAKNKGLMPKRSKLQRNPRLKNRMKFEKATKKRKGAVRPIRDQQRKYSGEAFGVNARVKKGVKLS